MIDSPYVLKETWNAFVIDIKDIRSDFDAFVWTDRLCKAILHDAGLFTGISRLPWRPLVPLFGLSMIFLVVVAYFLDLRQSIVAPRWGHIWIHDGIVLYLGFMLVFHFIAAATISPGLVVVSDKPDSQAVKFATNWKQNYELTRLLLLKDEQLVANQVATTRYHPYPLPTWCDKCKFKRPARAHHCSVCNHCVLQYDHHCGWLNACIGLHNFRHFIGTVLFLIFGCLYGTLMMWRDFYEPLMERVKELGWKWNYEHATGFLDLPPPMQMLQVLHHGGDERTDLLVKLVYPLLVMVGAVLVVFLGQHTKYMSVACTTVEYQFHLSRKWRRISGKTLPEDADPIVNPYDAGSAWGNITASLGPVWMLLLPVSSRKEYLCPVRTESS